MRGSAKTTLVLLFALATLAPAATDNDDDEEDNGRPRGVAVPGDVILGET